MYQSVMAKQQQTGSSGTGFAFAVVEIRELHPDKNICLAQDLNTSDQYQLGLNKRGETAWPQIGDRWVIDRSMGHWMLQCKVTDYEAPTFTGNYSTMDADLLRLLTVFQGLGLVQDGTTAGTVPSVTGSRAQITPALQQVLAILDARGILNDLTTPAVVTPEVWVTPTLETGWTNYTTSGTQVRYKLNYDNTVTIEGRAVPPGSVSNGALMFTLDSNYAPPVTKYFTTMVANGVAGDVVISPDGSVKLWDFGATTPVRVLFHFRFSRLA